MTKRSRRVVFVFAIVIALAGTIAIVKVVRHYFSHQRLIGYAHAALEQRLGIQLQFARGELKLPGDLNFYDIAVVVPDERIPADTNFNPDDSVLLHAKALKIHFQRTGWLRPKIRLRSITIDDPEFSLTNDVTHEKWNWQLLFAGSDKPTEPPRFGVGPPITLNNGQITFTDISDGERLTRGRVGFSVQATPKQDYYRIKLTTWTAQAAGPQATIDFNPKTGQVLAGQLPPIEWRHIELTIPEPYRQWCRRFNPAGIIGVNEIEYLRADQKKLLVVLKNVRAKIPLSQTEWAEPDQPWFLNFTDLNGRIAFTGDGVHIEQLVGKLNGGPCQVTGTCRSTGANLSDAQFDLHITANAFTCPDYLDPSEQKRIRKYLPRKLANILHDFKPQGKIDLDLNIARSAGPEGRMQINGKITPDQISAEYRKFPFRVDNVTGAIVLADGSFLFRDIKCQSAGRPIELEGSVSEQSREAQVELDIELDRVKLDKKLYDALPERYRRIWRMFDPDGWVSGHVRLFRPKGPQRKFQRSLDVTVSDTRVCYEKFKYPLDRLTGKLIVQNDELQLKDLQGLHDTAEVTISGHIDGIESPKPTVAVALTAHNMQIDEALLDALPEAPAQMIRDCQLAGTGDLKGTINVRPDRPWDYQFDCDLKNASICYRQFPYTVDNLAGQLVILPGQVTIKGAFARQGDKTIRASGHLDFTRGHEQVTLTIDADNIPVDSALYKALDDRQRAIWDSLAPTGQIDAHAKLSRLRDEPWTWRLEAQLDRATVRYANLPEVVDLTGKITFSPGSVVFDNVIGKGRNGAALRCSGKITTADSLAETTMKFDVVNLPITDGLLKELGSNRLVRSLKWKPGGTLTCRLDPLNVSIRLDDTRQRTWNATGMIDLEQACLTALTAEPVRLTYKGTAQWTQPTGQFAGNGTANLSKYEWKERVITDVTCRLAKKLHNASLGLSDIQGRLGTGQLGGLAELQFLPDRTRYGVQLTLQDVPVHDVLLDTVQSKSGPVQGKMRGEVHFLGTLAGKYVQRGGGLMQISGAEVLKIPLFADVYRAVRQEPPKLTSIHDVIIRFIVEQHTMHLLHIEMTGQPLSMLGYGTVNLSNQRIRLHLITASPKKLRNLRLLEPILRAGEDLTEVQVTGTVDNWVIHATPLRQISDTLKSFLQGKRELAPPAKPFHPR